MSTKRVRNRIDYKETKTSDSDSYIEISSFSHIPTRTSSWDKEICNSLMIEYVNAETINEIIHPSNKLDNKYNSLILDGWNKETFITANRKNIKADFQGCIRPGMVSTLIHKIAVVLKNEHSTSIREVKVDAFVLSLLEYLEFDTYPLILYPQCDYTATVANGHKITSKIEFVVSKEDQYIVLIAEDKHPGGISEVTDWCEPQIAGEIFVTAFHNVYMGNQNENYTIRYPLTIYAIRIVGTKFTFYKAEVSREYLRECSSKLPTAHGIRIKRYPQQEKAKHDTARKLNAWDFCHQIDREQILKVFKALHEQNQ